MRTKTLLFSAAVGAAGMLAASAQVYSVNSVGYINLNLPSGFSMIANQLNAADNHLSAILPNAEAGDTVFKWNGTGFDSYISIGGGTWLPDVELVPGEGAFIQVANPLTVTLVGEVPQGALTLSMPAGLSIISSMVPQSAPLGSLGLPADAGDTIFAWNGSGYDSYISIGGGAWLPEDYAPAVGESVFISRASAADWVRNFSVNN
jgi:hypothetical protein